MTSATLYMNNSTRDDLNSLNTPVGTDTWTPLPHIVMVEKIEQRLRGLGYGIASEGFSLLGDNGEDMFGIMRIGKIQRNGWGMESIQENHKNEYGLSIGFKNSNRKKFAMTLGVGGNITVCSNGIWIAEMTVGHKHSMFLMEAINPVMTKALTHLLSLESQLDQRIEHYKNETVSRSERNDFVVTAFEQGIIPGRSMGNLFKEIAQPKHNEFKNDNLWGVYNCCTEILKKTPSQMNDRILNLTKMTDDMYQFQPLAV